MRTGKEVICSLFGFVNIYRDELRIKDYNIFKAYYCGLCKALGKRYNQIVRLGLSYDMTFLAILADSLCEKQPHFANEGCIKHIGKKKICVDNEAIDYSADMSILMTYLKLSDDISDEHSIKAFLLRTPYYFSFKKASCKYKSISTYISECLKNLRELEQDRCSCIDAVADCFAKMTRNIFEGFDIVLGDVGYNIGRYIYIADAYTDIFKDMESGAYNPYVCAHIKNNDFLKSEEFRHSVMGSLNMTLNALADSYRKLNIKRNKEILDNIIYMGLRNNSEKIFNVMEG